MTQTVIIVVGVAALVAVWARGPRWAFRWVYVPALLLVPDMLTMDLPAVPDLTPLRAASLGIILGVLTRGNYRHITPRWQAFDLLALLPALSFSISYGLATDLKGFNHELPQLILDWVCPYVFARALVRDRQDLRDLLPALAVSACALAILAICECRLAFRLSVFLWNTLGLGLPSPPHWGDWRWGFLRAYTHWYGPITLATGFAMIAPLMVAWRYVEPKRRAAAWGAAITCALGCVSGLSRGPVLVLLAVSLVYVAAARRMKVLMIASVVCAVLMSPFLLETAAESVAYTRQRVAETGNTANESGHYRIALFIMYGKTVAEVGWFGDRSVIGAQYEAAYSIDNAYLYLYLIGGWVGGSLILLIAGVILVRGTRAMMRASGDERYMLAGVVASVAAVSGCMANVWFAPDYVPLFWIGVGLLASGLKMIGPKDAAHGAPRPDAVPRARL